MSPLNANNLHRIFDKLDRNGDGFLSLDELTWFLDRIGAETNEEEIELLLGQKGLDRIDFPIFHDVLVRGKKIKNVDGSVVRDEEERADYENLQGVSENDLAKAFEIFDANGDGFISSEELRSALLRLGLLDENCGKDCKSMINVYDTNSDGKLDFEEFKNTMFSP